MGRLYLPLDWVRDAGLDPDAFVVRPAFGPEIASVVERLLAVADVYYARADLGVAALPADCRPAISAARKIYSASARRSRARVSTASPAAPWSGELESSGG